MLLFDKPTVGGVLFVRNLNSMPVLLDPVENLVNERFVLWQKADFVLVPFVIFFSRVAKLVPHGRPVRSQCTDRT